MKIWQSLQIAMNEISPWTTAGVSFSLVGFVAAAVAVGLPIMVVYWYCVTWAIVIGLFSIRSLEQSDA